MKRLISSHITLSFDTEGIDYIDNNGSSRQHLITATLVDSRDNTYHLHNEGRKIYGYEIVQFIIDTISNYSKEERKCLHLIGFGLGYDFSHILSDILNKDQLRTLHEDKYVNSDEYEIRYVNGKFATIRDKKLTILRESDKSIIDSFTIGDVLSIYNRSLLRIIEPAVDSLIERNILSREFVKDSLTKIKKGKQSRGEFKSSDIPMLMEYSGLECYFLSIIILHNIIIPISKGKSSIGIQYEIPKTISGPGTISGAVYKAERFNDSYGYLSKHLNWFCSEGVASGGRTEQIYRGFFKKVYQIDVNSCHPASMLELPNLAETGLVHLYHSSNLEKYNISTNSCTDDYYKVLIYDSKFKWEDRFKKGVFYVKFKFSTGKLIYPLPVRSNSSNRPEFRSLDISTDTLIYPSSGYSLCSGYELYNAVRDFGEDSIELLEGYCIEKITKHRPAMFVKDLYLRRKELKEAKDDVGQNIYKLIINSLFGKTSCSEGVNPFYNPFFALLITGKSRAVLYDMGLQAGDNLIAMSTDAVYVEALEDGTCPSIYDIGKELGQCSLDILEDFTSVKSGIYIYTDEDGNRKLKSRGYTKRELDIETLETYWNEYINGGSNRFVVNGGAVRFNSFDSILNRKDYDNLLNSWTESKPKTFSFIEVKRKELPIENGVIKSIPHSMEDGGKYVAYRGTRKDINWDSSQRDIYIESTSPTLDTSITRKENIYEGSIYREKEILSSNKLESIYLVSNSKYAKELNKTFKKEKWNFIATTINETDKIALKKLKGLNIPITIVILESILSKKYEEIYKICRFLTNSKNPIRIIRIKSPRYYKSPELVAKKIISRQILEIKGIGKLKEIIEKYRDFLTYNTINNKKSIEKELTILKELYSIVKTALGESEIALSTESNSIKDNKNTKSTDLDLFCLELDKEYEESKKLYKFLYSYTYRRLKESVTYEKGKFSIESKYIWASIVSSEIYIDTVSEDLWTNTIFIPAKERFFTNEFSKFESRYISICQNAHKIFIEPIKKLLTEESNCLRRLNIEKRIYSFSRIISVLALSSIFNPSSINSTRYVTLHAGVDHFSVLRSLKEIRDAVKRKSNKESLLKHISSLEGDIDPSLSLSDIFIENKYFPVEQHVKRISSIYKEWRSYSIRLFSAIHKAKYGTKCSSLRWTAIAILSDRKGFLSNLTLSNGKKYTHHKWSYHLRKVCRDFLRGVLVFRKETSTTKVSIKV